MRECICVKCGWKWWPRVERPVECPNCKSRKWEKAAVIPQEPEAMPESAMVKSLRCIYCQKQITQESEVGTLNQSDSHTCICKSCLAHRQADMEEAMKQALYGDK